MLLKPLLAHDESLFPALLFSRSRLLCEKTLALVYQNLEVRIPIPGFVGSEAGVWVHPSKLSSIIRWENNLPIQSSSRRDTRYPHLARLVKHLSFTHPPLHISPEVEPRETFPSTIEDLAAQRRDTWELMATILHQCRNVETVEMRLGMGIGEDIWRVSLDIVQKTQS